MEGWSRCRGAPHRSAAHAKTLVAASIAVLCVSAGPAIAQQLPDGVTSQIVARGDSIFHGAGFCYNCHGADGGGLPRLGGDLRDTEWQHADGSYDGLVQLIRSGDVSTTLVTSSIPVDDVGFTVG